MPAILNEAFISPFDKIQGRPQRDEAEETSSDIRNPQFLAAVGERGPGLGGGTPNPFQTNYHVTRKIPAQDPRNSIYNNLNSLTQNAPSPHPPHQSTHQHPHQHQHQHHHKSGACDNNCDRLITEILSCDECREKLKGIMRQLEIEEHRAPVSPLPDDTPDQTGGSPIADLLKDMDSNVITNIVIGIALLFFIDRIISARLRN
jgi:hypothetical protein